MVHETFIPIYAKKQVENKWLHRVLVFWDRSTQLGSVTEIENEGIIYQLS